MALCSLLIARCWLLIANSNILSVIVDGKWRPGVGDPTLIGWAIVAAYIATALLCVGCIYRSQYIYPVHCRVEHRVFWWGVTIVLLLLAANKQLDLQSWLTVVGRNMAKEQGWYGRHRVYQKWFVISVAAMGVCFILLGGWLIRPWRRHWLTFVGLVALLVFVVIRATSYGPLDDVLTTKYAGFKLRHILELWAITCIAVSAATNLIHRDSS